MSQQSQGQPPPATAGEYRRHVIESTENMLGILQLELSVLQMKQEKGELQISPTEYAHLLISSEVCSRLHALAVQAEQEATKLTVMENPKLVGPDGEPLSRPARRKIKKKSDVLVPDDGLKKEDAQA